MYQRLIDSKTIYDLIYDKYSKYLFNEEYQKLDKNKRKLIIQYIYDKNNPKWEKIHIDGYKLKYNYEISNVGQVRYNLKSDVNYSYIIPYLENNGYCRINLSDINNKQHKKFIHQLVALAFIPNPENKPQVNHINGNKRFNWVGNLEWVTPYENIKHAIITGLHDPYHNNQAYGEKAGACTHTEAQVRKACELITEGKLSLYKIAKKLGTSYGFIYSLTEGRWSHITKEYDIPQHDNNTDRGIREKIRKFIKNGKLSLEEVKKTSYPELGDEWNDYILNQINKFKQNKLLND